MQESGLTEIILLICVPQLSGTSILYFHILSFLRAELQWWLQLLMTVTSFVY